MNVYSHVLNGLHCGEAGIATSQQVSFLAHKMNDGLEQHPRKQNKAGEEVSLSLWRISRRFLLPFGLLAVYIENLTAFLWRCVCTAFSLLGSVFLFFFFLLRQVFGDVFDAIHCDKIYTCLNDHLPFADVLENHQEALFDDTIYTAFPYKFLSSVDGV